jgi:hypothetical protein
VRRALVALAVYGIVALVATPVAAGKRHHHKQKPTGVKGVVLNSTCPGACAEPPPPPPLYTGTVTINVLRAGDGALVASREINDGHFRIRVKRGTYDVGAIPPSPPPCQPTPQTVCPLPAQGTAIIAPCMTGETKRVRVRPHRMPYVELHVRNVCIV